MGHMFNADECDFDVKALIDKHYERCGHRHDFDALRKRLMDGAELVLALSRDFERKARPPGEDHG